jgi:hypothetical protein
MSYINLIGNLGQYTDEMSFEAISNAVLQTQLMEYATLRSGLRAGTTAVNILDVDIAAQARNCSWSDNATVDFTQVDIVMNELESKQSLCPSSLREYYLAEKLSASAHAEETPFEEVIVNLYTEKIKNHNEKLLATDLIAKVVAGGTTTSQAAASDADTILADVYALVDAIDPAYAGREDLMVFMSPTNFNFLRRALVSANLYHFSPTDNNNVLEIPGTGFKAIKLTVDAGNIATMIAGPAKDIVVGVGLEDDFDQLKMWYSQDNDQVRVMAAWRLGLAVVNASAWSFNGL